ncbi:hypothetical protein EXIGLDRAFT_443052 [Exidia glandulosa HHB12029]|uniref:Uncharacterized protein n=1 Tax=Exidia glandulosa HHB12029 TaxID=1314781 RepID=A0A165B6K3_EXIGL|nr:hypothetical protein EXIGLDRAFT_443052 [Exidia glandulosa HHB12029]
MALLLGALPLTRVFQRHWLQLRGFLTLPVHLGKASRPTQDSRSIRLQYVSSRPGSRSAPRPLSALCWPFSSLSGLHFDGRRLVWRLATVPVMEKTKLQTLNEVFLRMSAIVSMDVRQRSAYLSSRLVSASLEAWMERDGGLHEPVCADVMWRQVRGKFIPSTLA